MPGDRGIQAYVSGYVQGVGFRAYTVRHARQLGLTGYVRNLPDGRVEVVAEGPEESLLELLAALRRGPYGASVQNVTFERRPSADEFRTFGIKL